MRKILSDHQKRGQVLVPPFTHKLGPLQEVSWIKTILPELLWIALIQQEFGHSLGVKHITELARTVRAVCPNANHKFLGAASSFQILSSIETEQLLTALDQKGLLTPLRMPLEGLIAWYPECPLKILWGGQPLAATQEQLAHIKDMVSGLYDRSARDPMMVQATATWLAFDADILKVNAGLALAQFPEIEHYPTTELSQKIGSGIRASLNMFFGTETHYSRESTWPTYFWNRGLIIDRCEFADA